MHRKERLESYLHREVGDFLDKNLEREESVLVSVTSVNVSDAQEKAEVFVSVFPENKAEETFRKIKKLGGQARRHMGAMLRGRKTPEITFILDRTQEAKVNLEKLLENIDNK